MTNLTPYPMLLAITFTSMANMGIKHFLTWNSTSIPEAISAEDYSFVPLPAIVNAPPFELTRLSDIKGLEIEDALVWLFDNFEPVVSRSGWMNCEKTSEYVINGNRYRN